MARMGGGGGGGGRWGGRGGRGGGRGGKPNGMSLDGKKVIITFANVHRFHWCKHSPYGSFTLVKQRIASFPKFVIRRSGR
jgi:hypothetical protein